LRHGARRLCFGLLGPMDLNGDDRVGSDRTAELRKRSWTGVGSRGRRMQIAALVCEHSTGRHDCAGRHVSGPPPSNRVFDMSRPSPRRPYRLLDALVVEAEVARAGNGSEREEGLDIDHNGSGRFRKWAMWRDGAREL